jgi:hypothetical protein
MIIVVEVASGTGTPTLTAAIGAAMRELRAYPRLRVTNIWIKNDPTAQPELEEEW